MRYFVSTTILYAGLFVLVTSTFVSGYLAAYAQEELRQREFVEEGKPKLSDTHLKVEVVAGGLNTPTTMAFLGPNDILVLEKDKGTVQRIVNGKMLSQPILDVNVAISLERCMCVIAI
jgi:glucose/arabinose dehydrogenase